MYLLDTNIVSELRKASKGKADPNVMKWFEQIEIKDTYLSAATIGEIKIGILNKKRKDTQTYLILNDWFENYLCPQFEQRILPIDKEVALICAEYHVPDKSPVNDAYIAATAKVHHLILVTRNTKDFEKLGIKLLNPFVD